MGFERPSDIPAIIDGHRVIGLLGQGGMGRVLAVERISDGRRLAMKLLLPNAPIELIERFEREAEAQARVADHPRIVAVHGFGRSPAGPWMTLELVEGGSLADHLSRGPLSEDELGLLLQDIGAALEHLHCHNIIHRDLKPANILRDSEGHWRLADFGLARLLDADSLSRTGEVLGTPAYMAPEQIEGGKAAIAPATDVYGLGAVLYHAATGRAPFEGKGSFALMNAVLAMEPPSIQELRPELSPGLRTLIERALEKNPGDRFPSSAALVRHFEAGCAPTRPTRRGLRRVLRPLLVLIGAPLLVLLLVLLTGRLYPGRFAFRTFQIKFDDDGPVIRDGEQLRLAGRVTGPTRVLSLRARGREVRVAPDGRFEEDITIRSQALRELTLEARGFLCFGRAELELISDESPPELSLLLSHQMSRLMTDPKPAPTPVVDMREKVPSQIVVNPKPRLVVIARDPSAELTIQLYDISAERPLGSVTLKGAGERRHVFSVPVPADRACELRVTVKDRNGNGTDAYLRLTRSSTIQEVLERPVDQQKLEIRTQDEFDRLARTLSVLVPEGTVVRFHRVGGAMPRRFIVAGSRERPVVFKPAQAEWGGFESAEPRPNEPGAEVLLAWCVIESCHSQHRQRLRSGRKTSTSGGAFNITAAARFEARHCTFKGCASLDSGGFIYVRGAGKRRFKVTLSDCRFINGRAQTKGGAVQIAGGADAEFERCVFESNLCSQGGAVSVHGLDGAVGNRIARAALRDCQFLRNRATGDRDPEKCHGGALAVSRNGRARLYDCRFKENSTTGYGGAIAVVNNSYKNGERGPAKFDDTRALERAGLELERCQLSGNGAPRATALFASGDSSLKLSDCRITGCPAGDDPEQSGTPALVRFAGILTTELNELATRAGPDKKPPAAAFRWPQLQAELYKVTFEQPEGARARRALSLGSHCLIKAEDLEITGFHAPGGAAVQGRSVSASPTRWIFRRCRVRSCSSSGALPPVAFHGKATIFIEDCEFTDLTPPGLLVRQGKRWQVRPDLKTFGRTSVRIRGCRFRGGPSETPALRLVGVMDLSGDPAKDNRFEGNGGYRREHETDVEGRDER